LYIVEFYNRIIKIRCIFNFVPLYFFFSKEKDQPFIMIAGPYIWLKYNRQRRTLIQAPKNNINNILVEKKQPERSMLFLAALIWYLLLLFT